MRPHSRQAARRAALVTATLLWIGALCAGAPLLAAYALTTAVTLVVTSTPDR